MSGRPPGTSSAQISDPGSGPRPLERWETVIGLEVHCQLLTRTKLFCGCSTAFGAEPNHHACPVCLGLPGVLPVLNRQAVDHAVKMALAVGAEVKEVSVFARKQYFYPDLPKGYQITQYDKPYCEGGQVRLASGKVVRLIRIHIEEDAGKNVHAGDASFVDVNRAGTPLIEIVSHPDLASPEEASEYLRRLRTLVRHLGISDGNLEEGSFRCDANVSLRPRGATTLGTRCEIKNLNSFRNIERAIWVETLRQAEILEGGGAVKQQTLLFDAEAGRTAPMRSKEESHDYRYFPDPDLKPLYLPAERIAKLRAAMPELPEALAERYIAEHELTGYDAAILTSEPEIAAYFAETIQAAGGAVPGKIVANWVLSEVLRDVNEGGWTAAPTAPRLGKLLALIGSGKASGKIAKMLYGHMRTSPDDPGVIMDREGLVQVSDAGAIKPLIEAVVAKNPAQVEKYLAGNEKLIGFFVGQIMRESGGKMNPALVNSILKEVLDAKRRS